MKAITNIVVPVDLEEHTEKLVEYSDYMAKKLSADLILIHVIEPFRTYGDLEIGASRLEEYSQNRLNHAREAMENLVSKYSNCKNAKVITGDIVDEILNFAETQESSLIIIGTHGSKGIEKLLLGSVAERVVKNAHCPILVMNPYKQ